LKEREISTTISEMYFTGQGVERIDGVERRKPAENRVSGKRE